MAKITAFNYISLNGFIAGENGDIGWHRPEMQEKFAEEMLAKRDILLFGRVTYDLMASYWPTPQAQAQNPELAEAMNSAEKIVFSKTTKKANWNNSRVLGENILQEMLRLKNESNRDMTLLGSGSILSQFAAANLIDEYQCLINPVALAKGTPIFNAISKDLELSFTSNRIFSNGNVLVTYRPTKP